MMKSIKYLCHYDFQNAPLKREYPLSAATKMDYIISAIIDAGYFVELYSMAPIDNEKLGLYKGYTTKKKNCSIQYQPTVTGNSIFCKLARMVFRDISLLYFLLFKVRRNEPIIVYHSPAFIRILFWAKKIKRFKLILEAEEIYHDVSKFPKSFILAENRLLKSADAYLFSTELLHTRVNSRNKAWLVNYGTYNVEPQICDKFGDGKIHVVYAGTFDPNKGGVAAAVAAGEFLASNYHLHILGFGSVEQIQYVKRIVDEVSKKTQAKITYDGLLKGLEYIGFLQKCHIGLSTQKPDAAFSGTSFPSKVLSYMSNGLSVVSIRIDAIEKSKVGSYIKFYDKQEPMEIAKAIMSTAILNQNRVLLGRLSLEFNAEMKVLLDSFNRV